MDQISPPMRIVLVVAVVFAAAYMLVLKPKDEAVAPAPAPAPATAPAAEAGGQEAGTGLGKAVEGARDAAGAAEAGAAARSGETQAKPESPSTTQANPGPSTQTEPVEPAVEPTDEALADLPKWLRESMDRKVVALLFTDGQSADGARTERALKRAYDGNGQVVTRAVDVFKIAEYQAVAEGLDVSQSPTLMVIARDRTADAVSGYASVDRINQMIIDGLLATENPASQVEWLKLAQDEGRRISNRVVIGVTEGTTPAGAEKNINASLRTMENSLGKLRNAPIPKQHADVKQVALDFLESEIAAGRKMLGAISPKGVDAIAVRKIASENDKLANRALLELNAVGVDSWN